MIVRVSKSLIWLLNKWYLIAYMIRV